MAPLPKMIGTLALSRCPHCAVARPFLGIQNNIQTNSPSGVSRRWAFYACGSCGGVVVACGPDMNQEASAIFPATEEVSSAIPEKPRALLSQARESLHAPAGAVMLAASAIDAMLKDRGFTDGSLYARIDKAAESHLITDDMAKWAHSVRLDANDQRHADQNAPLPSDADARRCIDFASALAEILFVLPSRVTKGLHEGV